MNPYCLLLIVVVAGCNPAQAREGITSAYTALSGKACRPVQQDTETGASTSRCPGIAGFTVLVLNSDERASISVIAPNKHVFPLNFWDVVAPSFSTLGKKTEWRVVERHGKKVPIALVVRIHTVDQADLDHPKPLSYLVVAKISDNEACVTHKVDGALANANDEARKVSTGSEHECLPALQVNHYGKESIWQPRHHLASRR